MVGLTDGIAGVPDQRHALLSGCVAEIVAVLHSHERGLEVSGLVKRGEKPDDLLQPLAYLSFHQWIGASEGWERIWLPTDVRERLGP